MKVLLDENLDHRLRKLLVAHDVYTVDSMGWAGLKNGELLSVAEAESFEVFLTGDKTLPISRTLAGGAWLSCRIGDEEETRRPARKARDGGAL